MTNQLVTTGLCKPTTWAALGEAADRAAARRAFADYTSRKAENTVKRQRGDLDLFARFLADAAHRDDLDGTRLQSEPEAWRGITWGMVDAFTKWQLTQGYAVGSVNVRLSTVKTYARLALKSGVLNAEQYALIRAVEGYTYHEARRINDRRAAEGMGQRVGDKKAAAVQITDAQAKILKRQPNTPQGRRDALLMALLLDLGLRCGEVALLQVSDVRLSDKELTFYRPKVGKVQTHRLHGALLAAVQAYMHHDALAAGPLLRASASKRDGRAMAGQLTSAGMRERAIHDRVRRLGRAAGIEGLSPHDCRHYWATKWSRKGVDPFRLQEAGGWNSLMMPRRYIEAARIANEGMADGDGD